MVHFIYRLNIFTGKVGSQHEGQGNQRDYRSFRSGPMRPMSPMGPGRR